MSSKKVVYLKYLGPRDIVAVGSAGNSHEKNEVKAYSPDVAKELLAERKNVFVKVAAPKSQKKKPKEA